MNSKLVKISEITKIPTEIISSVSKTELISNKQIYLENHKGIISYRDNEVIIRLNKGRMVVTGSCLNISCINTEAIELKGLIDIVKFENME